MKTLDDLLDAARHHPMRIVLCEGDDSRVLQAARRAAEDGIAHILLLGADPARAGGAVQCIDPQTCGWLDAFADTLLSLRRHRGMTPEQARDAVLDPLTFAHLMVREGHADGAVSGAVHTTANVVRTALQVLGKRPGVHTVSSFFIMMRDAPFPTHAQAMVFSDCGLVIEPSAEELAEIALASAHSARTLLGVEPRVAMLSFSTQGSAHHAEVDKVRHATELVRAQAPDLAVEGEMQLDTAIVPEVASRKWPGASVAGQANVLIFPNLAAGNIGYKLSERLGGVTALGPLLQGLNKPANDLSRGCSEDDIYQVIAVTAVQAQHQDA
ncbi:phosphate acetyltransferase [Castellaniella sp.]|uniref:phosphate acetyltransferase n=1 Tax=Castellaniella sp. TaxID=1955812 RepID=UPI002AFE7F02|nr:phosphate acetyltransferase [Castellaniella sp.]